MTIVCGFVAFIFIGVTIHSFDSANMHANTARAADDNYADHATFMPSIFSSLDWLSVGHHHRNRRSSYSHTAGVIVQSSDTMALSALLDREVYTRTDTRVDITLCGVSRILLWAAWPCLVSHVNLHVDHMCMELCN